MIVSQEIVSWCWLSLKKVFKRLVLTLKCFGTLHCDLEYRTKAMEAMCCAVVVSREPRTVWPCYGGLSVSQSENQQQLFAIYVGDEK
jgi:hypothetical protein